MLKYSSNYPTRNYGSGPGFSVNVHLLPYIEGVRGNNNIPLGTIEIRWTLNKKTHKFHIGSWLFPTDLSKISIEEIRSKISSYSDEKHFDNVLGVVEKALMPYRHRI